MGTWGLASEHLQGVFLWRDGGGPHDAAFWDVSGGAYIGVGNGGLGIFSGAGSGGALDDRGGF